MQVLRSGGGRLPFLTTPYTLPAVAAALAVATTLDVLAGGLLRRFDAWAFTGGLPPRTGAWHFFWRTVVNGGQYWLVGGLVGLAAVLAAWRGRDLWLLVRAGIWLMATEVAIRAGQIAFGRTPPRTGHDVLFAEGYLSYPSGHAANAAACLTVIVLLTGASRRWAIAAHVLALGVAVAVVTLGYHWPTDAIAGWGLGLAMAGVARAFLPWKWRESQEPPAH
ncbi:phosphatase PAP2 family protein [Actinomadura hibisca]|uniref:phosphatase PAP2 family protein n=1 Tax=Actinomadura hibisca TaxID=68565 RepID=UPI000835E43C|nr:phosphatase PAP2 family protein [Actinomadura hibisca]